MVAGSACRRLSDVKLARMPDAAISPRAIGRRIRTASVCGEHIAHHVAHHE
jgi:hypothetical protein